MSGIVGLLSGLMLAASTPAGACGLDGRWISDARGVVELVIIDDAAWEHYANYRFRDGGAIRSKSQGALAMHSARSARLSIWRLEWIDKNTVAFFSEDHGHRRFHRLEHCVEQPPDGVRAQG